MGETSAEPITIPEYYQKMKQQWNSENLNICYSTTVPHFGDGFEHAKKQGIPLFIEEYRIARVKDAIAPWITEAFPDSTPQILDIGCGHGWYPFRLIDKWNLKGHITGIDISRHNIELFQNEIKKRGYSDKLSANIANAEALPFDDNTFDLVYSTEALEHIESPSLFFKEASRVLKPGGKLIITTPSGPMHTFWKTLFWLPSKIHRLFIKPKTSAPYPKLYDKPLSWKEIKKASRSAPIRVEFYRKSVLLPHESYIQFFPKPLQHLLLLRAHILELLGPLTQWTGLHHIICFQKQR